jgi:TetR/AcrR family transcriptional regulator, cholesterol catabolism regulator
VPDPATDDPSAPPERSARRRRGDERRRHIHDVAARIFNEKGFEGTSLQDIADAVGVLKSSLYYYIRSKDELLYSVVYEHHHAVFENVRLHRDVTGPTLETIRSFIEWHCRYNARHVARAAVYYHEFRYLSSERLHLIIVERNRYEHFLRELLHRAREEGQLRPNLDPTVVTMGVFGMLNAIWYWYRPDGPLPAEEVARQLAAVAISGITGGAQAPTATRT